MNGRTRWSIALLLLALLLPGLAPAGARDAYLFRDEFNGRSIDPARWTTGLPWGRSRKGCCNELQWYGGRHGDNYAFDGSALRIVGRREAVERGGRTHPYTSGALHTADTFLRRHGRFEVRMKMPGPDARGVWPAFWLLADDHDDPGNTDELDVVEWYADEPRVAAFHAHHGSPDVDRGGEWVAPESLANGYHVYGLVVEPGRQRWYVDGEKRFETRVDYGDTRWFVVLNTAVHARAGNPAAGSWPQRTEVDWVRVSGLG